MDIREQVEKLERFYTFDRHELGRMLLVASATLLVFSVHSVMTLQESHSQMEQFEQDFDQLQLIINSQSFNQSIRTLEQVGQALGQDTASEQLRTAQNVFQQISTSGQDLERIQSQQQDLYQTYQWFVLISILGVVTGFVLLLM